MLRFWRDTQAEQGLHMDKERYQARTAENIVPLVSLTYSHA
jgi:hypothetical protein